MVRRGVYRPSAVFLLAFYCPAVDIGPPWCPFLLVLLFL